LNSRTAVLAAANPVFGRYDDLKSAQENIDFQTTILSRFDLIFIIKDKRDETRDRIMAHHVISIHKNIAQENPESEIDLPILKRYVAYCKSKCSPRLSEEAAQLLMNHYVTVRNSVRKQSSQTSVFRTGTGAGKQTIPITIRQLEAIIRISEALAKIELSSVANEKHVNEAIRLFKVSTLDAASSDQFAVEGMASTEFKKMIKRAEDIIKQRVPVGIRISEKRLVEEIMKTPDITENSINRAIMVMVQRGEFQYQQQRKKLYRYR